MKLNKTIKKITAIALIFAMLLGIQGNKITAKADSSPVNMYYCDDYIIGWRGFTQFYVYIQIDADSASDKQVYIHYNAEDDEWKDTTASYLTTIDNKEIWVGCVSGFSISGEYAIKYVGNGITYWDNNNGNNYTYNDILGAANVKAIRLHYNTPDNYKVCVAVKNIAYNKKVTVRYTEDNWASYKDVDLNYDYTPDGKDFEYWTTTLNLDENKMDNFYFCIRYEVNGQTYWDNNFGANYGRSFYRPL